MKRSVRYAVALTCALPFCWAEPTARPPSSSPLPSNATCSSASVNIITHGLPQQCLRSNWTSSTAVHNATTAHDNAEPSRTQSGIAETVVVTLPPVDTQAPSGSAADADAQPVDQEGSSASSVEATRDSTASNALAAASATAEPPSDDADSFLDAAKFLSFEDWKKQKLGEAGSSAEALARSRGEAGGQPIRQRPDEGLDTLGEDAEISLDFGGFASAIRPASNASPSSRPTDDSTNKDSSSSPPAADAAPKRSKDAGITCKERFNYASFDCAATILKTNPKCKSATSVLVENKDSYMLNECSTDNKFLIVELCEWAQIDTIVLANFEFFSSMFRTFRVSVSDRYPVRIDKWQTLGTFEARNTREIQAFLVENPILWAKYLRIEFLTHYGNEFYCPLSLLRVHGTNMMEDFRRMTDSPEETEELETPAASVPAPIETNYSQQESAIDDVHTGNVEVSTLDLQKEAAATGSVPGSQVCSSGDNSIPPVLRISGPEICAAPRDMNSLKASSGAPSLFAFTQDSSTVQQSDVTADGHTSSAPSLLTSAESPSTASAATPVSTTSVALSSPSAHTTGSSNTSGSTASSTFDMGSATNQTTMESSPKSTSAVESSADSSFTSVAQQQSVPQSSPSISSIAVSSSTATPQPSLATPSVVALRDQAPSAQPPREQAPSPHPPTQESIFKSITKRLALLEANATLSLQYIESQSALLRSAFAATNSQQLNRTAVFLEKLNSTVLTELARAKADYDQLWQSTVLELHGQREEGRKEREVLGERVRLLAEEVVGTKRLMAAQATLLLVVLALVLFTRNAPAPDGPGNGSSVDLRFLSNSVQGLIRHGRSRSNLKGAHDTRITSDPHRRWQWDSVSPWASPSQTRPGTSASAERDGTGLDRRSSDESSDPSLSRDRNRDRSRDMDKPLPPAPRPEGADEHEHSDAASERRDTVTQRNYRRPSTNALRIRSDSGAGTLTDAYNDPASPASPSPGEEHSSLAAVLRSAHSAPTTPSIGTAGLTAADGGLEGAVSGLAKQR